MRKKTSRPEVIGQPTIINVEGAKIIMEHVGVVNTKTRAISIARMQVQGGWSEPGQRPEFDEYTVVLTGMLRVEWKGGKVDVVPGQAVICRKGLWVRYSTLGPTQTEYISVCLPAFTLETVHRDTEKETCT